MVKKTLLAASLLLAASAPAAHAAGSSPELLTPNGTIVEGAVASHASPWPFAATIQFQPPLSVRFTPGKTVYVALSRNPTAGAKGEILRDHFVQLTEAQPGVYTYAGQVHEKLVLGTGPNQYGVTLYWQAQTSENCAAAGQRYQPCVSDIRSLGVLATNPPAATPPAASPATAPPAPATSPAPAHKTTPRLRARVVKTGKRDVSFSIDAKTIEQGEHLDIDVTAPKFAKGDGIIVYRTDLPSCPPRLQTVFNNGRHVDTLLHDTTGMTHPRGHFRTHFDPTGFTDPGWFRICVMVYSADRPRHVFRKVGQGGIRFQLKPAA
jgi:hypothetical protein